MAPSLFLDLQSVLWVVVLLPPLPPCPFRVVLLGLLRLFGGAAFLSLHWLVLLSPLSTCEWCCFALLLLKIIKVILFRKTISLLC